MRTELILVRMKFKMVHQYSSVLTIVRVGPCRMGISPARGGCVGGVNTSISGGPGYFLQENLRGNEQFKVWQRLILLRKLHE